MAAGSVITAASCPASAKVAASAVRFSADGTPERSSGCGMAGAIGGGGRSVQAASTRFCATGTMSSPVSVYRAKESALMRRGS